MLLRSSSSRDSSTAVPSNTRVNAFHIQCFLWHCQLADLCKHQVIHYARTYAFEIVGAFPLRIDSMRDSHVGQNRGTRYRLVAGCRRSRLHNEESSLQRSGSQFMRVKVGPCTKVVLLEMSASALLTDTSPGALHKLLTCDTLVL